MELAEGHRRELRVDHGVLLRAHTRADGTLLAEGYPVKEGVLTYIRNGQTVREYVPASTLAESAAGLGRLPVTLEHPTENGQVVRVTPANVTRYSVGDTDGTVTVEDGGFVRVQFAVRSAKALEAVRSGTRELSALYDAVVDPTPGEHPVFGRYDAVQVHRDYNSIALTQRGRAGREARLQADAADCLDFVERGETMRLRWSALFKALGITAHADSDDSALELCIDTVTMRADAAAVAHKTATDTLTADRDAQKVRADAAETKLAALVEAETARADAADRALLEPVATAMGLDVALQKHLAGLRRSMAAKYLGKDLKADASDEYVAGIVDLAVRDHAKRDDGRQAGRLAWSQPAVRGDAADPQTAKRRPTANEAFRAGVAAHRKATS